MGARAPVRFNAPELEIVDTPEGTIAVVLSKGVTLLQHRPNKDLIELRADRVVLFTNLKNLKELQDPQRNRRIEESITGAYLEDDVRIVYTPFKTPNNDQRLSGNRVYYEFATDRAILTDAVIHTVQPKTVIPIILRAKVVRQLAEGEFEAEKAQLSTSAFARPSYAIAADKIYVRSSEESIGDEPGRYLYDAKGVTFQAFGFPFFYLPGASGSMSNDQTVLRAIGIEHSKAFGTGVLGEFGLFETLGKTPPPDLDLSYRLDYHSDRGPAAGINARYKGGFFTETSHEPWSFEGDFKSYFVYDKGFDDVGRTLPRSLRDGSELRGHALFEHNHYLPDDWQVQIRAGYVSDQEFLEQWFPRQYDEGLPHDVSFYAKHQKDTEAFTLLAQFQPNDLVTTSDLLQEQFEVEHIPEIGYHRIGDSFWEDRGTFFSDNTLGGLHFQKTRATLAEQGFAPSGVLSPGIPSLGTTGLTNDTVIRGDFREEFDFPINAGQFKVVPYVVGRYTGYSDSPAGGAKNRFFAAAGARINTAFWKTDDTVNSDLFDLHRLRHVIEPEVNLFTSAQTVDRSDVFLYDEQIDPVNDISAAQIALHQRWQTYRGGPGRWRSVDFLTLNVEANFFANKPSAAQLQPLGFRGLFFASLPEISVPRNSVNADLTWRISDNTVLLADMSENLDKDRLAQASIGLVVRRDEHLTYYLGNRYIADLRSNITTAAIDYQISRKYSVVLAQSFDFGLNQDVASEIDVTRRFDTFAVVVRAFHNETTDQNGFGVNIFPNGLGYGLDSSAFESAVNSRR